mgnify:CR=1 FL=1
MTEKEIQEVCCILTLLEDATERINALIGAANARNAVSEYRQSQFRFVPTEKEKSKLPESR